MHILSNQSRNCGIIDSNNKKERKPNKKSKTKNNKKQNKTKQNKKRMINKSYLFIKDSQNEYKCG